MLLSFNKKLLTLLSILILSSCIQSPSPIFLRGEEFYGKRELEDCNEYYYSSDNTNKSIPGEIVIKNFDYDNDKVNFNAKCKFIYPINNSFIEEFQKNDNNSICTEGTLFKTDIGKDIIASAAGKVLYIGKGLRWYGNLIILEHENEIMTMYYYVHNINVELGEEVKQGQVIASLYKINDKISHNKPYMCFSIRSNGKALNALKYINGCINTSESFDESSDKKK